MDQPVTGASAPQLPIFTERRTRAERYAMGENLRQACPRSSHAEWKPAHDRDPVQVVREGDLGRIPQLLPLRHGRMVKSPFTFYRGAALHMAADLARTPNSGIRVQACGDAHLGNFRGFATPERRIVFDIHDLDETLPAPWEWDLKRLSASFVVACRDNGLDKDAAEEAVLTCVASYRRHMVEYSEMPVLELWYASLGVDELLASIRDPKIRRRVEKRIAREQTRTALEHDFPRLTGTVAEEAFIRDEIPTIYHWRSDNDFDSVIRDGFDKYRETLQPDRRHLLDRYAFKDIAIKVVGVGSVGTVCAVILLMAGDDDPLFLQLKEARSSVLEPYAGKSVYSNHGQRVVAGHRLMQSASDIFLGWTVGRRETGRHFYMRQLRDAKIKPLFETWRADEMVIFAEWCGHSLARSHARSGDAAMIAGYLGKSEAFDNAIVAFCTAYADQTERDHAALKRAARQKKISVMIERAD
jgi:uncharacterized protein (DUF2252 family)